MAPKYYLAGLLLSIVSAAHCGDAANGPLAESAGATASNTAPASSAGTTAAAGSAAKAGTGGATVSSTPSAGASGPAAGSSASTSAGAGGSGGSGSSNASSSNAGASAAAGSGSPQAAGSGAGATAPGAQAGGAAPGGPEPEPVATPYVWGVGLGTSDLAAAVKFYTEVMYMTVEKENVQREDRVETVLASTKAGRGSRLVLMKYNDNRETRKISVKLVWQSPSPSAVNTAAAMHPDYVSRLNFGIVQFDGPDTYIQEVGSSFDTGGAGIMDPYMVALGFSTSDQPKTISFWEMALGMETSPLGTFSVTDATGDGSIAENTLQIPTGGGSSLVTQTWTPMRNSKDNPVKVVVFVPDAQSVADKIMAAGGTIALPASRSEVYDNRLLIVAKDPDGYLIEVVQ